MFSSSSDTQTACAKVQIVLDGFTVGDPILIRFKSIRILDFIRKNLIPCYLDSCKSHNPVIEYLMTPETFIIKHVEPYKKDPERFWAGVTVLWENP